jgi:hypothetical protein
MRHLSYTGPKIAEYVAMSRFTVEVTMLAYPKGTEVVTRSEEYIKWADADSAFCAYQSLTKLDESMIQHVELIEHRETVVRKEATKGVIIEHQTGVVCLPRRA